MRLQPAIEICAGIELEQRLAERFDAAQRKHAHRFFLRSGQRPQPAFELPQDQFGLPLLPPFLVPTVDAGSRLNILIKEPPAGF